MKSLAERLKEKEAREAKERLKRSGPVKTFSVKIPICGYPSFLTEGDRIYIKKRAQEVMKSIRNRASWQFYQSLKEAIDEIEKRQKEDEQTRHSYYSTVPVDPAVPAVAAPHPQPSPVMEQPPVPTPTQHLESPGVSVREIDNNNTAAAEEQRIEELEHIVGEIEREVVSIISPPTHS